MSEQRLEARVRFGGSQGATLRGEDLSEADIALLEAAYDADHMLQARTDVAAGWSLVSVQSANKTIGPRGIRRQFVLLYSGSA